MSERPDDVMEAVQQWFVYVEDDLATAHHCILGHPPITSSVCYHCQQAAEKALKAYLVWLGEERIPRTHDLRLLAERAGTLGGIPLPEEAIRILNRYSTDVRYPDVPIRPEMPEARRAHELAHSLVRQIKEAIFSPTGEGVGSDED